MTYIEVNPIRNCIRSNLNRVYPTYPDTSYFEAFIIWMRFSYSTRTLKSGETYDLVIFAKLSMDAESLNNGTEQSDNAEKKRRK